MPIILGSGDPTARTFKDLQDEVLAHGFDDTRYRERVKAWLNEGIGRLVRRGHLAERESEQEIDTIAGQASYALEADIVRVSEIFEPATSDQIAAWDIDEIDTAPASNGKPYAYALLGADVVFYPTPDTAYIYTLRSRSRAPKLVNDGDIPSIADDYADLPIMWALHKAFAAEDDFEASTFWLNEFERDAPRARADLQRRQSDRVRQIPGMFAGETARPRFARPS